jgi:hypothetical protein
MGESLQKAVGTKAIFRNISHLVGHGGCTICIFTWSHSSAGQAPIHPDFLVPKPVADVEPGSEPPSKKQKPNRGMNKNKDGDDML